MKCVKPNTMLICVINTQSICKYTDSHAKGLNVLHWKCIHFISAMGYSELHVMHEHFKPAGKRADILNNTESPWRT